MMATRRRIRNDRSAGDDHRVVELARQLAVVLSDLGLAEIEVESREVRVRVRRGLAAEPAPPGAAPASPVAAAVASVSPRVEDVTRPGLMTIEAPMVGTFYRAPSPTADSYVQEGDVVKEGQILCIIEAMKLMNEIESKVAGRVVTILVENGQPVEYGQPLFVIDPQR